MMDTKLEKLNKLLKGAKKNDHAEYERIKKEVKKMAGNCAEYVKLIKYITKKLEV